MSDELEKIRRIVQAARALIKDVRRRYPGEELKCPYMRELDAALEDAEK